MPDINLRPYAYREEGRRPRVWLLLAAGLGFAALALARDAPWWIWPPVLFYLGGCLFLVIANPTAGMRLDAAQWEICGGGFDRTLRIAEIDHVSVERTSDGPDDIRIHMTDGRVLDLPAACRPTAAALVPELRRARIRVTGA